MDLQQAPKERSILFCDSFHITLHELKAKYRINEKNVFNFLNPPLPPKYDFLTSSSLWIPMVGMLIIGMPNFNFWEEFWLLCFHDILNFTVGYK